MFASETRGASLLSPLARNARLALALLSGWVLLAVSFVVSDALPFIGLNRSVPPLTLAVLLVGFSIAVALL